MREAAEKVFGESSGQRKKDKQTSGKLSKEDVRNKWDSWEDEGSSGREAYGKWTGSFLLDISTSAL